ncbi:MAG: AbrB/MazE/SpoVT family DNA-binding domain-containing protein [Nanoarchaeota archaeon]|nr:AbrB/MazE/SpoVT family DNA-binding domain-containing protein [Nanoarchaeota archaeon]
MKKYARKISCDSRGQLVIPKEVRKELLIDEGTGFWVFLVEGEGILLKRIDDEQLDSEEPIIKEIIEKSSKLGIEKKNIDITIKTYSGKEKGGFREI